MVSEDFIDELNAIEAIYPECLSRLNDEMIDLSIPNHEEYKVRMSFTENYPETEQPHILQVRSNGHDDQYLETLFKEVLDSVYKPQCPCIFDFLTELDGILYVEEVEEDQICEEVERVDVDALEGWIASDPVVDRGSTFIAFVRPITTEKELFEKLYLLKTDRRIVRSSHNMLAYRIKNSDGTQISDCDDDGETAAGGRLLHLLTVTNVWNVAVVVSRWFGGAHIGPDRFKHINSTARQALENAGFLDESKLKKTKKKK